MDLQVAVPEAHVSKEVLEPGLEVTTRVNEKLLQDGKVPFAEDAIRDGVQWKPEPPGAERFDHAGIVHARGWGDCDDLAPWHAASLRVSGEDPYARAVIYRSGENKWHAVVQRGDGDIEDPSRWAGMGKKVQGIHGAVTHPMFKSASHVLGDDDESPRRRPGIMVRTLQKNGKVVGYVSRVDLPWDETPNAAITTLNRSPVASQSVVGAIRRANFVGVHGGCGHAEDMRVLSAISGLLSGDHPRDVLERCGEEALQRALPFVANASHVVGFNFGKFLKSALPIASTIASFIPGVGPVLKTASDVAMAAFAASDAHGGAPQIMSELAAVVAV